MSSLQETSSTGKVPLSIVIPTRDRADRLRRTLEALATQSVPTSAFEVLVVDNESRDHTRQVALSYQGRLPRFRLLSQTRPGAAAARNAGIEASQGEFVLFLDDDVIPDPVLLEEHLHTHERNPGVAVLGLVRFLWTGRESPFHWLLTHRPELLQSFRFPDPSNVPFLHFYTCNVSVPRILFDRAGLFDEAFSGYGFEDTEFGYRIVRSGHRLLFNPRAAALHDFQRPFKQFASDRYRAGQALHRLFQKHPDLESVLRPRNKAWRCRVASWIGLLATPLAPFFDRPVRGPSLLLPVLGRCCGFHLEHLFWTGFAGARCADFPRPVRV